MALRVVKPAPLESAPEQGASLDLVTYAKDLERAIAVLRDQLSVADASIRSIRLEADARIRRGIAEAVHDRDVLSETVFALREYYAEVRRERAILLDEKATLLDENATLGEATASLRCEIDELVARFEGLTADAATMSAENDHLREQLGHACEGLAVASAATDAEMRRLALEIERIQSGRIWRVKRALLRAFGR